MSRPRRIRQTLAGDLALRFEALSAPHAAVRPPRARSVVADLLRVLADALEPHR